MARFTGRTLIKTPEVWNVEASRQLHEGGEEYTGNAILTVYVRASFADGVEYDGYRYEDDGAADMGGRAVATAAYDFGQAIQAEGAADPMELIDAMTVPPAPVTPI